MAENKYIQTPSQSIQKSYLRQPVETGILEKFRSQLSILLKELNPTDIEEANKGRVKTFLEHTLWPSALYEINAVGRTDLTIKDKNLERNVVLFEFKRVNSLEMVTKDDMVRKGMFELILYYILEEHENKNNNIKHLILSDGYRYFVFEKGLFWDLFGKDKKLVHDIISSEHTSGEKREYIYTQIIKPKVEAVKDKLEYTFVDLDSFTRDIESEDIVSKPKFKALYKLFSPTHLQKLPFSEDHNTLNKRFYTELLYIMGLEERGQKHQIQRLKEECQQPYSLFEQAYAMLADYEFNETAIDANEDKRFETALGLVIVWINRTLFMKLLESQLIAFNSDRKKFAFFEKITDFGMMHYLFCKVMAIPENERSEEMKKKFGEVPYLNSSLFELTAIEKKFFPVSSLRNSEVEIMKGTCLKNKKDKVATGKIGILDYLKQFLDSYDFGADAGESGKTIINASVLGLIFEKINGYKDGSFFTPGYITSYLCRETLRRCVTDKYNAKYGTSYSDFAELAYDFDHTDKVRRDEVNNMINSIRVCDPAVGSGHFVVSALNEFIAIKRELNVLKTIDGKRFKYRVDIEDDELVVTDADGELRYNPDDAESQIVQETLFEEKRTIIENCLFGVDINPNSAEICQLRLWIELLKHAYYQPKGSDGKRHLQTLPNIDINIKCGNSLVMKYTLDAPIDKVLRGANVTMGEYRKHVADYKNCPSKENKRTVEQDIAQIKSTLDEGYDKETSEYKKWVKVCSDILARDNSLFPPEEEETKVLIDLRKKEAKLRQALEEVSSRHARLKAFEWRYEFPEVLNDKGQFDGFECIIGNPPYGVSIQNEYRKTVEEKYEHVPDYKICLYFISLGQKLLKNNGYLAYIIPNSWLFNQNAQNYRETLNKIDADHPSAWTIHELLDCTNIQIFDSATVRNTVMIMQKSLSPSEMIFYKNTRDLIESQDDEDADGKKQKDDGKILFGKLVARETRSISFNDIIADFAQNWGLAFFLTKDENRVVGKIEENTATIESVFEEISQGIIAYDKLKGVIKCDIKNRIYHHETYHEGCKQWLRGFDVNKYKVTWNTDPAKRSDKKTDREIYVEYDKIPKARNKKYFMGKRMLIREITNPSLFAAITDEELYHDPAILVVKDSEKYSLELACAILNSQLAAFYHFRHSPKATKGAFPKIMIADVRSFPLPVVNEDNREIAEKIEILFGDIQDEVKKPEYDKDSIKSLQWQIDYWVFKLYGIEGADINIISEDFMETKPSDINIE
ncbi:MAG: Eco57I restriction-modification methylase domain-containing protein [Prevotellaceae bacterium]|nr:Eco57I restriction-modification methylase domain-containing protein [Candidatus Minthosoma equi]